MRLLTLSFSLVLLNALGCATYSATHVTIQGDAGQEGGNDAGPKGGSGSTGGNNGTSMGGSGTQNGGSQTTGGQGSAGASAGGASAAGSTSFSGGAGAGGASGTGGATATGGASATGGAQVTGGTSATGGASATCASPLVLAGTPLVQTGRAQIVPAWSPSTQNFALVGKSAGSNGIYFGTIGTTGDATWGIASIVATTGTVSYFGARLAWSSPLSRFGVAFSIGSVGGAFSALSFVSATGVADATTLGLDLGSHATFPAVATRASGDLMIVNHDASNTYVGHCTDGLYYLLNSTISGEISIAPRIATSGDLSAVIYQIYGTHTVNWFRVNASIVAGSPAQLTSSGQNPDITGIAGGYAMAWSTAAGFDYQVYRDDGSLVCGPTHVAFGNGILETDDAVAVANTQYGPLVLAADDGGKLIHLFRMNSSCQVVDDASVHNAVDGCRSPAIAVGGGYVALSWLEYGNAADSYIRVMGERLCN